MYANLNCFGKIDKNQSYNDIDLNQLELSMLSHIDKSKLERFQELIVKIFKTVAEHDQKKFLEN